MVGVCLLRAEWIRKDTQAEAIKTLLAQENIRAKTLQELDSAVRGSPH